MAQRFICNGMLGKLCKLLRMCGIDTLYSNAGVSILLEAKKHQRIILTKSTHIRDKHSVFFIEATSPVTQLREIIEHYNLHSSIELFSRCIECNNELESVKKEVIKGRVPYFTYKNFTEFALCPKCKRVYWKGSHYKNMLQKIKSILDFIPVE